MEISEIRTAAPAEGRAAVELETFALLDRLHIPYAWVAHETVLDLVCRLLLEKKQSPRMVAPSRVQSSVKACAALRITQLLLDIFPGMP